MLGKLYRGVDCKTFYKSCLKSEHSNSILLDYYYNYYILPWDKNRVVMNCRFHEYLIYAFDQIVVPMKSDLHDVMMQYRILNEGELFCTSLTFNLDDDNHGKLIGDPG